jgi:hypothetical protein
MLPVFAAGCHKPDNIDKNGHNGSDNSPVDPLSIGRSCNPIALAAYKNVEDNGGIKALSANPSAILAAPLAATDTEKQEDLWEDENGNWHAYYPYDFVQINSAVSFEINLSGEGFLESICGEGIALVIIADFIAYSGEEITGPITGGFDEHILLFFGRDGMYSCLTNGGGLGFLEFSSHKTLTDSAIEKDLTPPIRLFNVDTNTYSIEYLIRDADFGQGASKQAAHYEMVAETQSEVKKETVYSVVSLQAGSTLEVFAQIESTETGSITISGNSVSRLQRAGIDELTAIRQGDETKTAADLTEGSAVRIVYSKFYSLYDPVEAFVDLIEILPQENINGI